MGKIARELAAPLEENLAPPERRRTFDPRLWQWTGDGDELVHVETGELADASDFRGFDAAVARANPFDDDYVATVRTAEAWI